MHRASDWAGKFTWPHGGPSIICCWTFEWRNCGSICLRGDSFQISDSHCVLSGTCSQIPGGKGRDGGHRSRSQRSFFLLGRWHCYCLRKQPIKCYNFWRYRRNSPPQRESQGIFPRHSVPAIERQDSIPLPYVFDHTCEPPFWKSIKN